MMFIGSRNQNTYAKYGAIKRSPVVVMPIMTTSTARGT